MGDSLMKEFFAGIVALVQRKNTCRYREIVLTSTYRERVLNSTKCRKTMENLLLALTYLRNLLL